MAKGLTDCKGHAITIGDRVRTADGRVLEVRGIALRAYRAEDCEVVPRATRLGVDGVSKAAGDGDTVVWGN